MGDIYFQGFWRMDWGLGNPNKTATLIAVLMVTAWGLAFARRWGFWAALILFSSLGVCLVHTFSRGGLVALFAGLVPLLVIIRRPWPWLRIAATIVAIWVVIGASLYLQAHKRYGQGVVAEDRSISNRLDIWKSAPVMMVDAPGGWGIGNAGKAYMDWYQPPAKNEVYRTLVNSHLTWLVELGWLGRFLYVAGWLVIFLLCFPTSKARWLAVPFGIWLAFLIGALFSSVAESIWLWIVPGVSLVWVIVWRLWRREWFAPKLWLLPPTAAAAFLLLLQLSGGSSIQKSGNVVFVQGSTPDIWIVLDKKVLGDKPGRHLRAALPTLGTTSFGVVEDIRDLPARNLAMVILAGNIPQGDRRAAAERLKSAKSVTLVNPPYFPQEFTPPSGSELRVLIGEFSQSPAASSWTEKAATKQLAGVADFVPDWPRAILAPQS